MPKLKSAALRRLLRHEVSPETLRLCNDCAQIRRDCGEPFIPL